MTASEQPDGGNHPGVGPRMAFANSLLEAENTDYDRRFSSVAGFHGFVSVVEVDGACVLAGFWADGQDGAMAAEWLVAGRSPARYDVVDGRSRSGGVPLGARSCCGFASGIVAAETTSARRQLQP